MSTLAIPRELSDDLQLGLNYRPDRRKARALLEELGDYHPPTFYHSMRVGFLASKLGKNHESGNYLVSSAYLHDIGKLGIPLAILRKSEPGNKDIFTHSDEVQVREHTQKGYEILIREGLVAQAWVALTHHMYQKNSYPSPQDLPKQDTSSTELDICARVVSILDSYDATRTRVNTNLGRIPNPTEARDMLISARQKDSDLIAEFYRLGVFTLGDYPTL